MVDKGKLYSNNGTLIGEFYYVNGKMVSAAKNENNMYRYRKNMFKNNEKWLDEKDYLRRKYLT